MTSLLKDFVFGLSRGFGIYFSERHDSVGTVMMPGRVMKISH